MLKERTNKHINGGGAVMKCYTFHAGNMFEGMATIEIDARNGDKRRGVYLGQDGYGNLYRFIDVDKINPPVIDKDGTVFFVYPNMQPPYAANRPPRPIFSRPTKPSRCVVVRVLTSTSIPGGADDCGYWEVAMGAPRMFTNAHGRSGDNVEWADDIVIIPSGSAIAIKPVGMEKFYYRNDGGVLSCVSYQTIQRMINPTIGLKKVEFEGVPDAEEVDPNETEVEESLPGTIEMTSPVIPGVEGSEASVRD